MIGDFPPAIAAIDPVAHATGKSVGKLHFPTFLLNYPELAVCARR
jgi:hypothetical protein